MGVSQATYEQVALEDGDATWEYVCGQLREKPSMTQEHNETAVNLGLALAAQLDRVEYRIRINSGRLRTEAGNSYVPDVAVIPAGMVATQHGTERLETYARAVPFVAEVWSRSTGNYDVDTKIPDYRERGDEEIWRVQPYEKVVAAWRRQSDGSYVETVHRDGRVRVESLPGVEIDLDKLFS